MSIQIENLTKQYGSKTVLRCVNLTIDHGMFGLLGPNGAGKTTLMRILCTLVRQTSGSAMLNGVLLEQRRQIRSMIGYLPQDFTFYPNLSVQEALDYIGILAGIKEKKIRRQRMERLMELTNLQDHRMTKVREFSGGMTRRLGIAQLLLHDPAILIVDEPTAGLDPEERIRFRNLLSDISGEKTVLLSTHIAEDIVSTCQNLAVLNKGSIVFCGRVSELTKTAAGAVWETTVPVKHWELFRQKHIIISAVMQEECVQVKFLCREKPDVDAAAVAPTLEDAYMNLVRQEVEINAGL